MLRDPNRERTIVLFHYRYRTPSDMMKMFSKTVKDVEDQLPKLDDHANKLWGVVEDENRKLLGEES